MNRRSLIIAALLSLAAGPLLAQERLKNFIAEIEAVTPGQAGGLCVDGLARAETANAFELLKASTACRRVGKPDDTAFLTLIGQARAMADMSVLPPTDEAGRDSAGSLYGLLFYYFGGPGDNEVYRDPARAAAVMARHEAWKGAFGADYDPGWKRSGSVGAAVYATALTDAKAHRTGQLRGYVILQADAAYVAASDELDALQKKNPKGFIGGTPDYARAEELMAIMGKRAEALGQEP